VRRVGVYPETKHPAYFAGLGLPLEPPLLNLLRRYDYEGAGDPVFIQSFEVSNLVRLASLTKLPLVQLVASGARTCADLVTPAGLREIARYASAIGPDKDLVIPRAQDSLGCPTTLVRDAHEAGLLVHAWTFRAENAILPDGYRSNDDPNAPGDLQGELARFLALGLDGFFTDHPAIGVRARDAYAG
jgi:glycerophosphoryl diester phosphodiesterase